MYVFGTWIANCSAYQMMTFLMCVIMLIEDPLLLFGLTTGMCLYNNYCGDNIMTITNVGYNQQV